MTIPNILLHTAAENLDPERGPAAWALGLAGAYGARITALAFEMDVVVPHDDSAPNGNLAHELQARAAALSHAAAEAGVEVDIVAERSYAYGIPEIVAGYSRPHDMVVTGVDHTGLLSERSVAEHLIFESGRPVVVVPRERDAPFRCDRIVVAWDWTHAAARALGDAMPLLARADSVSIVTYGDDKEFASPVNDEDLISILSRRGLSVRHDNAACSGAPVGEALGRYSRDQGADLLVMGGYGHSRLRRFIVGGATKTMLDAPPVPVLLSHWGADRVSIW